MKKLLILVLGLTAHLTSYAAPDTTPLTVNFTGTANFSSSEYTKLLNAKKILETVVNSEAFKTAVLNFSYLGETAFVQNNGMSNQEIYDFMMAGAERYPVQTEANHQMDLNLALYTSSWFGRGTLGYTDISTSLIHMNTRFYDNAAPNEVAMNLAHEWMHKLGFDHDQNRTARRDYSVPYGIGYLVRDLGKTISASTLP